MSAKKKNRYLWFFTFGVLVLIVPQIRILVNELRTVYHVTSYQAMVEQSPQKTLGGMMHQLNDFNQQAATTFLDPFEYEVAPVANTYLSGTSESDMFGFIDIPKIGERLPIYNGASTEHLAMGAAFVTGTSLPIGGLGTHSVISAHRGYAGANFFRYIDLLEPGDRFTITILNEVLIYEVTGSAIVSPNDASRLGIRTGEDLVTLLSCHPYRVNNQRILVFAKRVSVKQVSLFTKYPNLVASTQAVPSNRDRLHKSNGMDGEEVVTILLKFLDPTLSQSVRNDILLNRLTIFLGLIAMIAALGLIGKNRLKERKLPKQQRYTDDFL